MFKNNPDQKYMVFDVESFGLYGEGFAYGYVVIDGMGKIYEERLCSCNMNTTFEGEFISHELHVGGYTGDAWFDSVMDDRDWLDMNIPCLDEVPNHIGFEDPKALRKDFLQQLKRLRTEGVELIGDCIYPVETNFIAKAFEDVVIETIDDSPFIYDINLLQKMEGLHLPFLESELPQHNPLNDAKQSARVFVNLLHGRSDMELTQMVGE